MTENILQQIPINEGKLNSVPKSMPYDPVGTKRYDPSILF